MGNKNWLLAVCFVLILDWQCSSCQHLASAYRLGGGQPATDNITVLSDRKVDTMGPFAPPVYQEPQWKQQQEVNQFFREEAERIRRDVNSLGAKDRPDDSDRLLVQTLNGLVRGTRKTALGESVDVYLGVRFFFSLLIFLGQLTPLFDVFSFFFLPSFFSPRPAIIRFPSITHTASFRSRSPSHL